MPGMHILIVGGGANGVAAFIQLVSELIIRQRQAETRFTIVDQDGVIGEGLAFGTKQPGHLLNTQSRLMGIHPYEPEHYCKWLEANKHLVNDKELKQYDDPEDSYTTRRLYSNYLKACFSRYLDIAKRHSMHVECIKGEVLDIRSRQPYGVFVGGLGWLSCDFVVLTPGTPKPRNYEEFEVFENYIDFPWPSRRLLDIPSDATVGILGTSLSAIDAVMTLTDSGHKGKIQLLSPDGLLPRVQPKKESNYVCRYLTMSSVHALRREQLRSPTVTSLFRLFQREVENYCGHAISWKEVKRRGRSAFSLLEEDIAIAESGGDAFLNIVYAMRELSTPLWQWLSLEEKQRFKKWLGIDWLITRHAMPLHNARRLKRLFGQGRLIVHAGLGDIRFEAGKFHLSYGRETTHAEYLINATGPGNAVEEMKSTLISNLCKSGIIESYPLGGIRINATTMQIVSSRHPTEGIYAVGHLVNGMLPDVNAVWFNVRTIAAMAEHILSRGSDR